MNAKNCTITNSIVRKNLNRSQLIDELNDRLIKWNLAECKIQEKNHSILFLKNGIKLAELYDSGILDTRKTMEWLENVFVQYNL